MEIKTEFNIDDEIYFFIHNNLLREGTVAEITVIESKATARQIMYTTGGGFQIQEQFAGKTPEILMNKLVSQMNGKKPINND